MTDFDLQQTDIPVGISVIEASAGTGKTWTIAHLVPRLLVDGVVNNIGEILLVTFTEDAARELEDRTRRQLATLVACHDHDVPPEATEPGIALLLERLATLDDETRTAAKVRLRLALEESDQLWVSTIHAFCKRVLATEPFLCGLSAAVTLIPNDSEIRADAVKDTWRADIGCDPILAEAASVGKWSVKQDLKSWEEVTRRPEARFDPDPTSLKTARQAIVEATSAVLKERDDLLVIEALAQRDGIRLNRSGQASVGELKQWHGLLTDMDPEQPAANLFEITTKLADGTSWFSRRSSAGKTACKKVAELPVVRTATEFTTEIKRLTWAWTKHVCDASQKRLELTLRQKNAITYSGLIARLHASLCREGNREVLARRLATRWRVGLIDESQDTDGRQLEIFRAVFQAEPEPGRLILVGDPKQAIYSFRGGDLDAYLSARPADNARVTQLSRTYRSAEGLVAAMNALFGCDNAFGDARLAYPAATAVRKDAELPLPDDGQARFVAWLVPDEDLDNWQAADARRDRAADCTATAIVQLLDQAAGTPVQPVNPAHVAVLTRTNQEAEQVATALQLRGVPAVVRSDKDVMQSDMASDLILILRSVLTPQHNGWRRAALATRLFRYDAEHLLSMTDDDAERQLTLFSELGDLWRRRGIAGLMAKLENSSSVLLRLAEAPAGERYLTDLRHLFELLQTQESHEQRSPEMLLDWFDGQRMSKEVAPDERSYRIEKDDEAVQVVTVHKAKGLEFDFVFCPYLWSALESRHNNKRILVRRDGEWVFVDGEQRGVVADADRLRVKTARLIEEIRLTYVALTRACRRVTILAGPIGYGRQQYSLPVTALDWLLRTRVAASESVEDWCAAMSEKKQAHGSCTHQESLERLCRDNQDVITICPPPVPTLNTWKDQRRDHQDLSTRPAPALVLDAWNVSSFSSLAHGRHEEQDRRDIVANAVTIDNPSEIESPQTDLVPLWNFARGTRAGNCLHELLETWDFAEEPTPLVKRSLQRQRLYSDESASAVQQMLDHLKTVQLQTLQAGLDAAASDKSQSEWEFLLPLGATAITGTLLSETFAQHARTDDERQYAKSLAGLPGSAVSGMLTGYIDRIVRSDDQWAVLDWKSNYLGSRSQDYAQKALWECAASQHYILQVHLYLVALRRYLRLFDAPATAASGCIVFLRGVQPRSSEGLLELLPPDALLTDLDALFDGEHS
jgi:exodeoxyribonuclease V beta subunit